MYFTMEENDYLKAHKNSGIKEGDKVKVLRSAMDFEQGWDNTWSKYMDTFIGKTYTVDYDGNTKGFLLSDNGYEYDFPWFVLELIEKIDKDCLIIKPDILKVTYDNINKNYIIDIYDEEKVKVYNPFKKRLK